VIVGFTDNQMARNGTADVCEVDPATNVACPAPSQPALSCPDPVCPTPVVQGTIQNCRKCRTRRGTTSCTKCTVQLQ
jgi:hypothetical protein